MMKAEWPGKFGAHRGAAEHAEKMQIQTGEARDVRLVPKTEKC
jgi:hypothetical protein